MQLTCPTCHARNSIEACVNDDHARRAIKAAAKLPAALGAELILYVGLFRPRARVLSWRRAARLLEEVMADVVRGNIRWKGRDWPAPAETWRAALEQILNAATAGKLTLPLESHGYLYAILAGIVDRAEAAREEDIEKNRRAGRSADGSARQCSAARAAHDIAADLRHFRGLLEIQPESAYVQDQVRQLEQELERAGGAAA